MTIRRIMVPLVVVGVVTGAFALIHRAQQPRPKVAISLSQSGSDQRAVGDLLRRLETLPRIDLPGTVGTTERPAPSRTAPGGDPSADPAEVFDGRQFLSRLEGGGSLTAMRRKDLESMLAAVSAMQEEIMRFPEPAKRAHLQENLIHQLVVRLRLALGDKESEAIATLLTEKRPYILFDKDE